MFSLPSLSLLGLDQFVLRTLNHVLAGEAWACERLRLYAGQQALIQAAGFELRLVVDGNGTFVVGSAEQAAAVTITLPSDLAVRLLVDRGSLFQAARLSGSADFAETLAFVFRNLRWDAEADLARYLGDIPAHRLEQWRRHALRQGTEATRRLGQNLAEYATEDSDWLAPKRDIEGFAKAIDELRDDVARLEKRLGRL
jgi:ubiquinone biosynthesis protein UbiJ